MNESAQKVSSSIKTLVREAGDAFKTGKLEPAFAGIERVEKAAEQIAPQKKVSKTAELKRKATEGPRRSERLSKQAEGAGDIVEKTGVKVTNGALSKTWSKLPADELKKIGKVSAQWDIRQISGNTTDALNFFKAQVESFTEKKPGEFLGRDKNGVVFYFRSSSKSGPPTIDVNGITGLRKIKFLDE